MRLDAIRCSKEPRPDASSGMLSATSRNASSIAPDQKGQRQLVEADVIQRCARAVRRGQVDEGAIDGAMVTRFAM